MDHKIFQDQGNMLLQNVRNHLSSNTVSHPRRMEASITAPQKPQNMLFGFLLPHLFSLPYSTEQCQTTDFQILSRTHTF